MHIEIERKTFLIELDAPGAEKRILIVQGFNAEKVTDYSVDVDELEVTFKDRVINVWDISDDE